MIYDILIIFMILNIYTNHFENNRLHIINDLFISSHYLNRIHLLSFDKNEFTHIGWINTGNNIL